LEISAEGVVGVRQQRTETDITGTHGGDGGLADELESFGDVEMCEEVCLRLDSCVGCVSGCLDLGKV
jgi:hypothetical protein